MTEQASLPTISIIGLGKLGSPMVATYASRGYRVIGVDINPEYVRKINEGCAPVYEPMLDELLAKYRARISATQDIEAAVLNSEITFNIVPTPSTADGTFATQYVQAAMEKVGDALRKKNSFHLVVLTSTVLPGDSERKVIPLLEQHAGKKCGVDFGFCYSPEFIALGSVIRDLSHPDFVLIGESDARAGAILERFYQTVIGEEVRVARMNVVNAELTKISVNTFVTTKISYANMLAELCEKIPGCDVNVVTSAIGLDARIGRKYLQGGLGYGGPCFPRDNIAFAALMRRHGAEPTIAVATDSVNRRQAHRVAERIQAVLPDGGYVGILGLSYKPNTNVIEESQGVLIAQALAQAGVPVNVYDPASMPNAQQILGDAVIYASSLDECVANSQVIAITTPWDEFKTIAPEQLVHTPRRVVFDFWRILEPEKIAPVADYLTIGKA